MELNNTQKKMLYLWCLEENLSISYGRLSLCDLRNFKYSDVKYNRRYQVHCEDSRNSFSAIYDDAEIAVNKFMELKKCVRRVK